MGHPARQYPARSQHQPATAQHGNMVQLRPPANGPAGTGSSRRRQDLDTREGEKRLLAANEDADLVPDHHNGGPMESVQSLSGSLVGLGHQNMAPRQRHTLDHRRQTGPDRQGAGRDVQPGQPASAGQLPQRFSDPTLCPTAGRALEPRHSPAITAGSQRGAQPVQYRQPLYCPDLHNTRTPGRSSAVFTAAQPGGRLVSTAAGDGRVLSARPPA